MKTYRGMRPIALARFAFAAEIKTFFQKHLTVFLIIKFEVRSKQKNNLLEINISLEQYLRPHP